MNNTKEKIVLGIGNSLKGDDGVGVYIAGSINALIQKIREKSGSAKPNITAIDCGIAPENYTSVIRKCQPSGLLIIDAAQMGLAPGSYRIIPPRKKEAVHLSTHSIPIFTFVSYVKEFCQEVLLIGIQPKRMEFGTSVSPEVKRSADYLTSLIVENRLGEIKMFEEVD